MTIHPIIEQLAEARRTLRLSSMEINIRSGKAIPVMMVSEYESGAGMQPTLGHLEAWARTLGFALRLERVAEVAPGLGKTAAELQTEIERAIEHSIRDGEQLKRDTKIVSTNERYGETPRPDTLEPGRWYAKWKGETIKIPRQEGEILSRLVANINEWAPIDEIAAHLGINPATARVLMSLLRKHLPGLEIQALRGTGYRVCVFVEVFRTDGPDPKLVGRYARRKTEQQPVNPPTAAAPDPKPILTSPVPAKPAPKRPSYSWNVKGPAPVATSQSRADELAAIEQFTRSKDVKVESNLATVEATMPPLRWDKATRRLTRRPE